MNGCDKVIYDLIEILMKIKSKERKIMGYVISIFGSYLVGTINPSYIVARIKGFDIRKSGSGNAGGSNAVITMGGKIGVVYPQIVVKGDLSLEAHASVVCVAVYKSGVRYFDIPL